MADQIKLTIDGKEIEVDKGTSVLQAAEKLGLDVPRYCYHPGLTIAGNCRICLVEIEKMPKLATSCTTQAGDGMVVRTSGAKVEDGRRAVMEFLLANHPLDCPICDQAGECRLQEYSFEHGPGGARFAETKVKGFKGQPIGPHVVLDTERCIVCTRCVRFCDEVTKTGELGVFQRGVLSYISTFPERGLDNPYSGNTVDICPVGALTLKEFRFKKRVWELKDVSSVCGSCARGCNVHLGTADNRIWRLTPRENQQVNRWWMCDEGRLSHQPLYATPRLTSARVRRDGASAPILWTEAVDILAARLKQDRPGAPAAIVDAPLTVEDLHVLKRLFVETLGAGEILVAGLRRGKDDTLLIRADKRPNTRGAELMGLYTDAGGERLEKMIAGARAGRIHTLIVFTDGANPQLQGLLEPANKETFLCVVSPFAGPLVESADLAIPAAAYGEFDGTWVNFEGRAQHVSRAVTPPGVALDPWLVAAELMRRMGTPVLYESADDVLKEVAATTAFKLLGAAPAETIGALGAPVGGAAG